MSDFDDEISTYFRTRFDPTPAPVASFLITAVAGPNAGDRWAVDETGAARVLVGTSPACQVRLRDRQISRRHLALEVEDLRIRVVDAESTNGTWLGTVKIGEVWLTGGEHLRLGETQLRFDRGPKPTEAMGVETHFGGVLGASREMRRLYGFARGLAASHAPVLIEGETGTGKELFAEALHASGPRSGGPFVVLDCAAIASSRIDEQLFGVEGPGSTSIGVLEEANGGTLLLDEIADLDPDAQSKLASALARGYVRRVGGQQSIALDARVLVTTRRDLDREVQAGRLAEDLYHRLAVTRIELPPLRKRRGDVPLLVAQFVRDLGGDPAHLPARLVAAWEELPWPGNVRELRNAVARYLAMGELAELEDPRRSDPMLDPSGDWLGSILSAKLPLAAAREKVLRVFERRYVEVMLEAFGGNVAHAATAAGIARRYFQILKARRND